MTHVCTVRRAVLGKQKSFHSVLSRESVTEHGRCVWPASLLGE